MASDDMVFVDSGPSMQVIPSSLAESLDGTNTSDAKEFPHTHSPASPTVPGVPLRGLAFRSKPGFSPYPPIPRNFTDLQHCCHGSCQQRDTGIVDEPFKLHPPIDPPPPPVYNGSTSGWLTPGARAKHRKTPPSPPSPYHVSRLNYLKAQSDSSESLRSLFLR